MYNIVTGLFKQAQTLQVAAVAAGQTFSQEELWESTQKMRGKCFVSSAAERT